MSCIVPKGLHELCCPAYRAAFIILHAPFPAHPPQPLLFWYLRKQMCINKAVILHLTALPPRTTIIMLYYVPKLWPNMYYQGYINTL